MLCSNVVIKIILSTIEKLGNVRNAPNLLYVVIYIEKTQRTCSYWSSYLQLYLLDSSAWCII